jgi:Laminin G domain
MKRWAKTCSVGVAVGMLVALLWAFPADAARRFAWSMNTLSTGVGKTRLRETRVKLTGGINGSRGWYFNGNAYARTAGEVHALNPRRAPFTVTLHARFLALPSRSVADYDLIRKGTASKHHGYFKIEIVPSRTRTEARVFCQVKGHGGTVGIMKAPREPLNDGGWHTITCTREDRHVDLAVDGAHWTKRGRTGWLANEAPLTIGAKLNPLEDQYIGRLDQASIQIGR